jgi:putative ABC transport system permease protein
MLRVTLKGLLGHKLRFALTALAVTVGVAFVVGSFVLTASVRAQFDQLFEDINQGVDLQARGVTSFDVPTFGGSAGPPIPAELLEQIQALDGVQRAAGAAGGTALLIDADGEPVLPDGGFPLGLNWSDAPELSPVNITEGRPPETDDEIVMDVDVADLGGFEVGDTVTVVPGREAPREYQLVGLVSFGDANALAGATLTGFTTPEAQRIFNLEDRFQSIEIAVADDADIDVVSDEVAALLPEGYEVVDRTAVVEEGQQSIGQFIDIFQNVLLGFAFVTLFVSSFLIYNTFRIVVGQRVRELALLRAVGASPRQVFVSVLGEALVIGLLSALVGFGLGILVAMALNAILDAAGFGAGNTQLVVELTPFVAALVVGLVVTLVSSLLPAFQATRVPPVAAMREGYSLDGSSLRLRFVVGSVVTAVGVLLLAGGLTADDGLTILLGMATGAVLIFLGVAGLSPLFAARMAEVLGAPFRPLGVTGRLATENAARSPRRTSSTAAALMIGLALVTMASVVGESVKSSFGDALDTTIEADWYVDTNNFLGFPPVVADEMAELDELAAVNRGRFGAMQVDGSTKQINALDFDTLEDMFDLGITEGSVVSDQRGVLMGVDPAGDLGVSAGDEITALFNEGGEVTLTVVAVYTETALLGNWIIDIDTYRENFADDLDFFVAATTAPGVSEDEARAAIEAVIEPYPQLRALDSDEYRADQEGQLDTVLIVVNVFLLFAVLIAGLGIANTLALSMFERTRELGLLRAVGETRSQLWGMVTMEAVIISVFGALLGMAVGVGFGVAIASALPDNFITIIEVPLGFLGLILVGSVVLGVVAAVYPAWRATRLDVLEAIGFE